MTRIRTKLATLLLLVIVMATLGCGGAGQAPEFKTDADVTPAGRKKKKIPSIRLAVAFPLISEDNVCGFRVTSLWHHLQIFASSWISSAQKNIFSSGCASPFGQEFTPCVTYVKHSVRRARKLQAVHT